MNDFFRAFFSISTAIAIAPAVLHLIDRALELFSPIGDDTIKSYMAVSPFTLVKQVANSSTDFKIAKAYFDFAQKCHFIVSALLFSIFSLIVAQIEFECTVLQWSWMFVFPIAIIVVLLIAFMFVLHKRKLDPLETNPSSTRPWFWAAVAVFTLVLLLEIGLRLSGGESGECPPPKACEVHKVTCTIEKLPTPSRSAPQ